MKLEEGPIIIGTASTPVHSKRHQVDLLSVKSKKQARNSKGTCLKVGKRRYKERVFSLVLAAMDLVRIRNLSIYINQRVEHGVATRGNEYRKESVRNAYSLVINNNQDSKVKDEFYCPSSDKLSIPLNKDDFLATFLKKKFAKEKIIKEESRKSLDVFGSHMLNKKVIEVNLKRKLSSDTSSDLFEIENISCSNGQSFFTRQIYDGMSKIDQDNITTPRLPTSPNKIAKTKSIVEKETQGGLPSQLLGCKSHKAVRVVEPAYKTNEKAKSYHQQQPQRSPVRKL
ncbi:hypothetical protein ACOSQ4_024753 [Xanthoceras sorbifolium]